MMVKKYLDLFLESKHDRKVVVLHKDLSLSSTKKTVDEIFSNNSAYILLTLFQVEGVGLNLQKFNMIIFLDRS
jgi:hypothetical protein